MPSYAYTALDARGQEVSDTLEAGNENEAIAALRQAGYYPTSVMEAGKAAKAARGKTAKAPKAPKAKATGLKKDINIDDYSESLRTNRWVKKDVVSIRSMNHQLYTLNQQKIDLTSFYDKCILLNEVDLLLVGYKRSH